MNAREVAKKIIQHMDSDHNMKVIPADFMIKIKHAIKIRVQSKQFILVRKISPSF
jgi:predicted small metal-binding protein